MKQHIIVLIITLLIVSCSKNPETFIEHIDGYWEIEEVTLADGSKVSYNYNNTIDYIELTDSFSGFRKKLKPNFAGTYEASKDVEQLKLVIENDSLHLYYTTSFSKWKETVLNASKDRLLVINEAKVMYLYKRYQPIVIE